MKKTWIYLLVALLLIAGLFLIAKSPLFPFRPKPAPLTSPEAEVREKARPLLVHLFRKGDAECDLSYYEVNEVAKKVKGRAIIKNIDLDVDPEMADYYHIESVPAIIIYSSSGKVFLRKEGGLDGKTILKNLEAAGLK